MPSCRRIATALDTLYFLLVNVGENCAFRPYPASHHRSRSDGQPVVAWRFPYFHRLGSQTRFRWLAPVSPLVASRPENKHFSPLVWIRRTITLRVYRWYSEDLAPGARNRVSYVMAAFCLNHWSQKPGFLSAGYQFLAIAPMPTGFFNFNETGSAATHLYYIERSAFALQEEQFFPVADGIS